MTVLFTVREESGLWGARFVEKEDLGNPVYGFNCDGPSPYEIIIGAVGAERWEVEIIGKGSHAGVSPEKGISSTMIASIALANIQKNESVMSLNMCFNVYIKIINYQCIIVKIKLIHFLY